MPARPLLPHTWIAALLGLATARRTGVLLAQADGATLRLYVIDGRPAGAEVERGGATRHADIVAAGLPLRWTAATWRWEAHEPFDRVHPDLLPTPMAALTWALAKVAVPLDVVQAQLDAPGELAPDPARRTQAAETGASKKLLALLDRSAGERPRALASAGGGSAEQTARWIWLSEVAGWLGRAGGGPFADLDLLREGRPERLPAAPEGSGIEGSGIEDLPDLSLDALEDLPAPEPERDDPLPGLLARLEQEPGDAAARTRLGWLLWERRDSLGLKHGDPVATLQTAFAHDRRNAPALEALARICALRGDDPLARRYVIHLGLLRPRDPWVADATRRLDAGDRDPAFWAERPRDV